MTVALDGVGFRYAAAGGDALCDVTLTFRQGEVALVTGRLGAGASTLLLVIAGLAPRVVGGARVGAVRTLGHDPASAEARVALAGRVGVLLSTPWTQLSGMAFTVRDEVAFGPANLGWPRARIRDAVDRALDLLEVAPLAARDPHTLSGGELQRVILAGIVAMAPELYLLDEPALELDPESARALYRLLPDLAARGSVIVASTDVNRAVDAADRVVLLDGGRVVADDAPPAVLGAERWVAHGVSATVAEIARRAGCAAPYPVTVHAAVTRLGA